MGEAVQHGVYTLRSNALIVEARPSEGGRISSLRSMTSGLEFLTQSHRNGTITSSGIDAMFRDGPCAGIEECLPTVAASGPDTEGGPAPDHGDFWQLPWTVLKADGQSLRLSADGFSRSLRFTKHLTVDANVLRVAYSIHNIGNTPQSFLYACHPLFAVDAGDRIVLPEEVHSLRLDYSRRNRLGQRGDTILWPVTQSGQKIDEAGSPDAGTADMFYTQSLSTGACSIHRLATNQRLDVIFDPRLLPRLGIWLCYGGWPDDALDNLQYAVALEPTTSPHNSLDEAQKAGAAVTLNADESFEFVIEFRVDIV